VYLLLGGDPVRGGVLPAPAPPPQGPPAPRETPRETDEAPPEEREQ